MDRKTRACTLHFVSPDQPGSLVVGNVSFTARAANSNYGRFAMQAAAVTAQRTMTPTWSLAWVDEGRNFGHT